MSEMFRTLAVIPARNGSKGIIRKNVQDICGLPLLAYSVLVAKAAESVDRVIVSTDDQETADLARTYGAEVPFLRPREISGDRAIIGDAVHHVVKRLLRTEGYRPDAVVTLYPTHPFRTAGLVNNLIGRLRAGYAVVIAARTVRPGESLYCALDGDNRLRTTGNLLPCHLPTMRAHRPYGLFVGESQKPKARGVWLHPLQPGIECLDIDEPQDLELARAVVRSGLFRLEEACAG